MPVSGEAEVEQPRHTTGGGEGRSWVSCLPCGHGDERSRCERADQGPCSWRMSRTLDITSVGSTGHENVKISLHCERRRQPRGGEQPGLRSENHADVGSENATAPTSRRFSDRRAPRKATRGLRPRHHRRLAVDGRDTTVVQLDHAVGALHEQRVVGRDDRGEPLRVDEAADEVHDRRGGARVELTGRLVGDQHSRPSDDRARHADALLLTAGQLAGPLLGMTGEPDEPQRLGDALDRVRRRASARSAAAARRSRPPTGSESARRTGTRSPAARAGLAPARPRRARSPRCRRSRRDPKSGDRGRPAC